MTKLILIYGDTLKVLSKLEDGSIDLVLTDPPYGITKNDWDIIPNLNILWNEFNRTSKVQILTSNQPFTTDLINSNRKNFKYDLIFEKTLGTGFLNAKKMPMRYHEEILVFYKNLITYNPMMTVGKRKKGINKSDSHGSNYGKKTKFNYKYDDMGTRYPKSVIKISTGDRTKEQYHPTGKPIALMKYLIKTYSNENDYILDCFLGSGTTMKACLELNRNCIGIEKEKKYIDITKKRLNWNSSLNGDIKFEYIDYSKL